MKNNYLIMMAFAGAMVWTGCQKNVEEDAGKTETPAEQVEQKTWSLKFDAGKATTQTKALILSQDGKGLSAVWESDEHVYVFSTEGELLSTTPLDVTPKEDNTIAELSGEITGDFQEAVEMKLLFPRTDWNYSLQYGLLTGDNSIEKLFDYALATITATPGEGNTLVVTGDTEFENQQSIFRFSFKHNSQAINAKTIEIASLGNKIVDKYDLFTPANITHGTITLALTNATTDPVYAAIRHDNQELEQKVADTFGFTVFDNDGVTYKGSKNIPEEAFANDFISAKNIKLNRLDVALGNTEVNTVL